LSGQEHPRKKRHPGPRGGNSSLPILAPKKWTVGMNLSIMRMTRQ